MELFLNTVECAEAVVKMGVKKAATKGKKVFLLGFMAGVFVSLAYIAYMVVYTHIADPGLAKFVGAIIFPVAIIFVLLAGGSLFTGNNLASLAFLTGDISLKDVGKNWSIVWIGNFAGTLFMVLICLLANTFSGEVAHKTVALATSKTELTILNAIFSGFLCNIVVSLAVWISFSATDTTGKIIAAWFPIMMFAVSGFQHIVANMFIISMGYALEPGAFSILSAFTNNFIPVTIGNALSGGIFIPLMYYNIYLKKEL